jgi:hypothetical protein
MTQVSCFPDRVAEPVLPATLELVRRCPARSEYIELCFTTPEGSWNWCFPEPPPRRKTRASPLALTPGPYGAQARLLRDSGLGPALPSSSALPMILAGTDVYVARGLVSAGY